MKKLTIPQDLVVCDSDGDPTTVVGRTGKVLAKAGEPLRWYQLVKELILLNSKVFGSGPDAFDAYRSLNKKLKPAVPGSEVVMDNDHHKLLIMAIRSPDTVWPLEVMDYVWDQWIAPIIQAESD